MVMATMNFSVPDDVKDAFNQVFEGQNKSAIIADLMRRAVEEAERRRSRAAAIARLARRREKRPAAGDPVIRKARESGRA
jgi:metal-responsive CopG/Arc/MetJ family transcriptional regulator